MSSCRGEQVIMDEWREDWMMTQGHCQPKLELRVLYMATSPSPCTHNECSSLPCLMDRSANRLKNPIAKAKSKDPSYQFE
jgi:hypothetical protein